MLTLPRYGYDPIIILLFSLCIQQFSAWSVQQYKISDNFHLSNLQISSFSLISTTFKQFAQCTSGKKKSIYILCYKEKPEILDLASLQYTQYKSSIEVAVRIMKNAKDELISQQIDIVIIGSRSFELLEILLDKDLHLVPMPKLKTKYLSALSSLYASDPTLDFHPSSKFPASLPESKIQKYTTNLLTDSFWLQFNFYYFGAISHDPLLAGITRGRISLCIIASTQSEAQNGMLKKLLTRDPLQPQFRQYESTESIGVSETSKQNVNREELIIEQKIINLMHNYKLNEFSSVLSVKMIDKNRIIEGTSNIKLNRYQILRWICERHFENQFGIKLRGELGDEIENYTEEVRETYCSLI